VNSAMKAFVLVLVISGLLSVISGCGGKTSSNIVTITNVIPLLSWTTPTAFSDGAPASASDVGGYRIYFGTSPGSYTTGSYDSSSSTLSVNISDLISNGLGTYYFAVTAITNTTGEESDYSNEVSWKL
jgi:hypothetical protein